MEKPYTQNLTHYFIIFLYHSIVEFLVLIGLIVIKIFEQ